MAGQRLTLNKKHNCSDCEIWTIVEGGRKKQLLFGGLSNGILNTKETEEWQRVIDAVNHVRSQQHTLEEIKKSGLTFKRLERANSFMSWNVYDGISFSLVLYLFACLHYIQMNSELNWCISAHPGL